MRTQTLSPAVPAKRSSATLVEDLRRFALDLAYPVVADRRLAEHILFYRQLALLVKSGIPVVQALRLREERAASGPLRMVIREALYNIECGGTISEVFALHPETIPSFQAAVIHAGEAGGRLDEAFEQIADCLEAEQRLRRFINRYTAYPKILYIICQFVIPLFFAFVMGGSLIAVIAAPLINLVSILAAVCVVFAVFRGLAARSPELALTYERIKWALPGFGRIATDFALCRFGRALGALYASGVPLQQALRLAGRASGSRLVERAAHEMAGYILHGVTLGDACRATAFFPTRTADMIATGAESGSVDTMMFRMASYLEEEAETRAHQAGFVVSQLFYLLVALYCSGLLGMAGGALIGAFVR